MSAGRSRSWRFLAEMLTATRGQAALLPFPALSQGVSSTEHVRSRIIPFARPAG